MRRMNLLTLSIKLPSLFTLADSLASLLFGGNDLFLDLCPNIGAGGSGSLRLCCIRTTHGFRFPLADPLAHEGWAVGFSHITAVHKQIDDRDIAAVVIHLELAVSKPIEQAWAHYVDTCQEAERLLFLQGSQERRGSAWLHCWRH